MVTVNDVKLIAGQFVDDKCRPCKDLPTWLKVSDIRFLRHPRLWMKGYRRATSLCLWLECLEVVHKHVRLVLRVQCDPVPEKSIHRSPAFKAVGYQHGDEEALFIILQFDGNFLAYPRTSNFLGRVELLWKSNETPREFDVRYQVFSGYGEVGAGAIEVTASELAGSDGY